ncbi:MAG: TusE/DsrC/DsvC family sulfur relay protein [Methylococcales bacterium]|jgi:tRNA 2-thiouridine synthesizing protein E|nr:TusE/DsrC/DsvC family sulfur relay protein [Methylococcales bacterium]
MNKKENRKNIRYRVHIPVHISVNPTIQLDCFTHNLSYTSIFLILNNPDNDSIFTGQLSNLTIKISTIIPSETDFILPCSIQHVSKSGAGISFNLNNKEDKAKIFKIFEYVLNIPISNRLIRMTPENTLVKLKDWSKEIATSIALRENIHLDESHWSYINNLRNFYDEFKYSPSLDIFNKYLESKSINLQTKINTCFPLGFDNQAIKISGLPCLIQQYSRTEKYKLSHRSITSNNEHEFDNIQFNGQSYYMTKNGCLADLTQWNQQTVFFLAEQEGVFLTQKHWEVINLVRLFYSQYATSPHLKIIIKLLSNSSLAIDQEELLTLFPKQTSRQIAHISGIPEPFDTL